MRAATEGSLPPVIPQGNLVEVLGREVRQGSPGELMVESTPSRQRRPPCKTDKEESDECNRTAHLWIGDSQQSGLRNSVIQLQELDSRWPRPDRSRIAISSDEDRILDD